ncbi:MAG: hypothetical protein KGL39_45190 [Patescibacteria group bacterium]|nr:hypothetical protein [Patescibacteria group bacterium]
MVKKTRPVPQLSDEEYLLTKQDEETASLIKTAKERWEKANEYWSPIFSTAREDLDFLRVDGNSQWKDQIFVKRINKKLPCITFDKLNQFTNMVVNSIRTQNTVINVYPSDNVSMRDTADAIKEIIRGIEYESNADDAYDMAVDFQVKCGIGFARVNHKYRGSTFDQDIVIERVTNPFSVYLDPDSQEIDGRDAAYCFIIDGYTPKEFKKKWPNMRLSSFTEPKETRNTGDNDNIIVAEYFYQIPVEKQLWMGADGQVYDHEVEGFIDTRTVEEFEIGHAILSGTDILEQTTFPGKFIPVVPFYGQESWVDGSRKLISLIRNAKDAQSFHNLYKSIQIEMMLKANRSPKIAPVETVRDFGNDYKDPDGVPVLAYHARDDKGNPLPPPSDLGQFQIPQGLVEGAEAMVGDIQSSMGIYNASMGQESNTTSGIAIAQTKQQGDLATVHFGDNHNKSVEHIGRIVVGMLPVIYNTARALLAVNEENGESMVGVNGQILPGQQQTVDLTQGSFAVRVATGPSYLSARQEAFAMFQQLFAGNPQMAANYMDLAFRNADFAGAQEMADRARKMLPPALQEDNGQDPQLMMLQQQNQQLTQAVQTLKAQLESKQMETQASLQEHQMKIQIEQLKANIAQINAQVKAQEMLIRQDEIKIRAAEIAAGVPLHDRQSMTDKILPQG